MEAHEIKMQPNQQVVLERFIAACQQDDRVIAAFLGGSYARGEADAFSDLDIYLVTSDEDFEDFSASIAAFMRLLGEPLFLESFGNPNILCYILADGTDGELGFGPASQFGAIHAGPYQILLDKRSVLSGVVFSSQKPKETEQIEKLNSLLMVFWHEFDHCITALAREQLWWAQGQLESLRGFCVSLARLSVNFQDHEAGVEPYFKIENAVPVEQMAVFSALQSTVGPLEKDHMLRALPVILETFKALALPLAQAHGIAYPEALEQVMVKRMREFHGNL